MSAPSRKRSLPARLTLLLVGLLIGLLCAEVAVRLLWSRLRPYEDVVTEMTAITPAVETGAVFGLEPNSHYFSQYDGDPYGTLGEDARMDYRMNELGFRDAPFRPRLANHGRKVALIGDSFLFGEGVRRENRYSEFLQAGLPDTTVFNLGVPGYSTYEQFEVAATLLPPIQPELTVLAYCLNDPYQMGASDSLQYFAYDLVNHRDEFAAEHVGVKPSRSPLYLWRLLDRRLAIRRLTRDSLAWYHQMYTGPEARWLDSREGILKIGRRARAANSAFGVMIQPFFFGLDGDYPFEEEHRIVTEWCRSHDIPVLDTLEKFRGTDPAKLTVHPKDRHPNAKAHRIIGEALMQWAKLLLDR